MPFCRSPGHRRSPAGAGIRNAWALFEQFTVGHARPPRWTTPPRPIIPRTKDRYQASKKAKTSPCRRDRRCKRQRGNNTNSSITLMHLGLSDGDALIFAQLMVQKRMSMWSGAGQFTGGAATPLEPRPGPRRSPGSRRPPGLTPWRSRQLVPRDSGLAARLRTASVMQSSTVRIAWHPMRFSRCTPCRSPPRGSASSP